MECVHYLTRLVQLQWRQRCGLLCLMFTTVFIFRSGLYLQRFPPSEMPGDIDELDIESVYSPSDLRLDLFQVPALGELLNITDFRFIKGVNGCETQSPFLLILVHSAPDHFTHRRVIRSTWGSVREADHLVIRLIFLLGETEPAVQAKLDEESSLHGDIVQGTFVDTYHNLTYKHLMGYKWVWHFCPKTTFVMKADDDIYVDMFRVMKLLPATFGRSPSNILSCSVFSKGKAAPHRSGKWRVTRDEYPYRTYPQYCSGMSYFVTPDVVARLLAASRQIPFLWIDDVYVTGLLVKAVGIQHMPMNLRITDDVQDWLLWLSRGRKPNSYMIGHLTVSRWEEIMYMLWNKTVVLWNMKQT